MLQEHFDELFSATGFKRRANGLAYTRKLREGRQRVDFDILMRPRYAKDSVQITLYTTVFLPQVGAIAAELLGEPFVRREPDMVQRELLGMLVRNPPLMLFRTRADLDRYARWIRTYLTERVLPHLDARQTVRDFAEFKVRNIFDNPGGGQWGREPVVIAAALLVLNEPGRARELLEAAYPPESPERPRFEGVFAAIGS